MERFRMVVPALSIMTLLLGACGVPSEGAQVDLPTASIPTSAPHPPDTLPSDTPAITATAASTPSPGMTASAAATATQADQRDQQATVSPATTQAEPRCPTPTTGGSAPKPQSAGSGSGQAQVGPAGSPIPVSTVYPANAPSRAERDAILRRVNRGGPQATPCR
jgi:hypothetical protein